MTFNIVVTVTSIAGLLLGLGWMFAGTRLLKRWGMSVHDDGLLLGRRLGRFILVFLLSYSWGEQLHHQNFVLQHVRDCCLRCWLWLA
jgi:hypothetical protein